MKHFFCAAVAAIFLLQSPAWAAEPQAGFTQKEFARALFSRFSWDAGLPKEPSDRDYLQILSGKRQYRFEAENSYNEKTDMVSVRQYSIYGPFSGKGWILGVAVPTNANFRVLLPLGGEYLLKAVMKGDGFVWKLDNREFKSSSKSNVFREVDVARVVLKAGVVDIQVTLPSEGAIDSFTLSAPDLSPIQPLKGWRFKEQLTAGTMAEIAASMMNLAGQLPESSRDVPQAIPVVEMALPASNGAFSATDAAFFGKFFSRKWIRAGVRGAEVQVPVKVVDTGFYHITANLLGGRLTGTVNDTPFEVVAKPAFEKIRLGLFRLEAGDNMLKFALPPMAGIDTVEFGRKSTLAEDFLALTGIRGGADRLITEEEAGQFLKKLQETHPVRK